MHFVIPVSGRVFRTAALAGSLVLFIALPGCSPHASPQPVEDSLTSGRISVVCADEAGKLVARERDAFQSLYPQASIEVRTGSSRDAIGALFSARCDLAVIVRELGDDERAAAMRGRLDLEGYRFARDALVAIVNRDNPVENLTLEELRAIYHGDVANWSAMGGHDQRIEPVVRPPDADVTQFLLQQVMAGQAMNARAVAAQSDSEVVAEVAARPGAVGYVTLAWADRGARALRISSVRGMPYWKPDPEAVYKGQYPLTRFFNLYARTTGRPLSNGLITYVTSFDGQKLVQEAGFVPTAVPVRFVRRSALLGAH
jgi:phosphate transport system substrate-binding protein